VAGGHGFKRATGNGIEGLNQILKGDSTFKTMMPVQDLIKSLQNFVDIQLEQVGNSLVSKSPILLKDESLFVGDAIWPTITVEEKLESLASIGMHFTDKIPGFKVKAWDFPKELAPNLSEEERGDMARSSKYYTVMQVATEPSSYVVTRGNDLAKVFTLLLPVKCSCKFVVGKRVICQHILAVALKFPEINLLERMKEFLATETRDQRTQRQITTTSGMKKGTYRRHGNPDSRNNTTVIHTVLDLNTKRRLPHENDEIPCPPSKTRRVEPPNTQSSTTSIERLPRAPIKVIRPVLTSSSLLQTTASNPSATNRATGGVTAVLSQETTTQTSQTSRAATSFQQNMTF
uniref:SWIM-type domain-containing protein n=1 Tax=Panagrolaimus sp. PS1159 TaxID=55785 RepID=A0AC35GHR9_9BILA